jgi:predicted nucleic acid-binding protein
MILVVDASVAVKWFTVEELHETAKSLPARFELVAPDLLFSEIGNGLWGKATRGLIEPAQADRSLEALEVLDVVVVESPLLVRRALAIALELGHPIYDCIYIACAERLGAPLVTADVRLFRKVVGSSFAPLVRHLRDFQAP